MYNISDDALEAIVTTLSACTFLQTIVSTTSHPCWHWGQKFFFVFLASFFKSFYQEIKNVNISDDALEATVIFLNKFVPYFLDG